MTSYTLKFYSGAGPPSGQLTPPSGGGNINVGSSDCWVTLQYEDTIAIQSDTTSSSQYGGPKASSSTGYPLGDIPDSFKDGSLYTRYGGTASTYVVSTINPLTLNVGGQITFQCAYVFNGSLRNTSTLTITIEGAPETYEHLTYNSNKIQVDSTIRDGEGVRIKTNYAKKSDIPNITISTALPSGGSDGDIWIQY